MAMISEARREQLRAAGRLGGKARAAQPDFREHQSRAGKRSAEVNDMAALGAKGAKAFIRKYGYIKFFRFWRDWKLANPSRHERQVMAILDRLGYSYEREAMVLGERIPVAVDFYIAEANDAVIEVNGRVHYDPLFDHPNYPETRRGNDLHRIRKLERAGFRVLEIDYRALANEASAAVKVAGFLL
jgi:hypothetical protein